MKITQKYWQLLNYVTKDRDNSTESQISIEEWLNHFSKLNSPPSKFVNRINEIKQILENKEKAVVPIAENPLKRRKPHCKLRKTPQNEI